MNVFDYLADISKEDSFYLKALNLNFEPSRLESELEIFRGLAREIELIPRKYGELISDSNWRSHLVAYFCLVVSKNKSHLDNLKQLFEVGSMVSPQIAVAMYRLHNREMMDYFPAFIDGSNRIEDSSKIGAVLSLMQTLGKNEITLPSKQLDLERFCLGIEVASNHSKFWSSNVGSPRC